MKNNDNNVFNIEKIEKSFSELLDSELFNFIETLNWNQKIIYKIKMSSEQKQNYKEYSDLIKTNIENKKEDFNESNIIEVENLNLWYKNGDHQALFDINVNIEKNKVTSLIGPSGCGKSTFIKCLNRMNDLILGCSETGNIYFESVNIKSKKLHLISLRTKIGMVFQSPVPFEMSIYENVAFGPKSHGIKDKETLDKIVEDSLINAALWNEVKGDLNAPATGLSGGQQQRLCIARTIALQPTIILMDEPTSALDPIATSKIEKLILELRKKFTVIIVTHSMAQAQRISDNTIFFFEGRVIESGKTKDVFISPKEKKTYDYINGKIG